MLRKILFYLFLFLFFKNIIFPILKKLYLKFKDSVLYLKVLYVWSLFVETKFYKFIHKIVVKFRRWRLKKNDIMVIYFGLPGSGKTTISAWEARRYRKAEYPVWSNEPLTGCYKLDPKTDISKFSVSDGLCLIDEAGSHFSNRNFKSNFTPSQMDWWRRYRHAGMRVSIFSQSWDDCDITFRRLAFRYNYVKRSLIPGFICIVPIRRRLDISDQTHEPIDSFSFDFPLLRIFTTKRIYAPVVWKDFDSWAMPKLPDKVWETW